MTTFNNEKLQEMIFNQLCDDQIAAAVDAIQRLKIKYHEKTAVIINYAYLVSGIFTLEELLECKSNRTMEQLAKDVTSNSICRYIFAKNILARYKSEVAFHKDMDNLPDNNRRLSLLAIDVFEKYPLPYLAKKSGNFTIKNPIV